MAKVLPATLEIGQIVSPATQRMAKIWPIQAPQARSWCYPLRHRQHNLAYFNAGKISVVLRRRRENFEDLGLYFIDFTKEIDQNAKILPAFGWQIPLLVICISLYLLVFLLIQHHTLLQDKHDYNTQ